MPFSVYDDKITKIPLVILRAEHSPSKIKENKNYGYAEEVFPYSFGAAEVKDLVIKIIVYLVAGAVIGWVVGLIPLVGGLIGSLVGLYGTVGIVLVVLDYLKVLK